MLGCRVGLLKLNECACHTRAAVSSMHAQSARQCVSEDLEYLETCQWAIKQQQQALFESFLR